MTIFERVNDDIKTSMKAKSTSVLEKLRNIKNHFQKESKKVNKEFPSETEAITYLKSFIKERNKTISSYEESITKAPSQKETAQVKINEEVIERDLAIAYLPADEQLKMSAVPLTNEELKDLIQLNINEQNITSIKDFGRLMGVLSKQLEGDDMKRSNKIARELLA